MTVASAAPRRNAPRGGSWVAGARARRCRRKFLRIFPDGFHDETYLAWEREYKWRAHVAWRAALSRLSFDDLLARRRYAEIAATAVAIEARTNLLFSFEKMALRDAVRGTQGAKTFSLALHAMLFGDAPMSARFGAWCAAIRELPRRQTRVLTWPLATVFPFIADPRTHVFFKPVVTRAAADAYGFDLRYRSAPSFEIYTSLLEFAARVRRDLRDLRPRDMIDIQSFIWVQGSDEYAD